MGNDGFVHLSGYTLAAPMLGQWQGSIKSVEANPFRMTAVFQDEIMRFLRSMVWRATGGLGMVLTLGLLLALSLGWTDPPVAWADAAPLYQSRTPSRDGIGKVYMGREISDVMGHLGAGWLERPTRIVEERPEQAIAALHLQPTDIVADMGAGTGYFTFRLSAAVPQGKVLAVDIQPEMIEILEAIKAETAATNVEPVQGEVDDPHLPEGAIDVVLLVDAYHEFSHPREMMQKIVAGLKPQGRVVLVEYRGENPFAPIKPHHKMTQRQVKKELAAVGLTWKDTQETLPQQHIMTFYRALD
jgi:precorrin-6B methylase 2